MHSFFLKYTVVLNSALLFWKLLNENLTSLYLAEKSRVLTTMVLRRRVARGVMTHFYSYKF
jgi:hypothetical protein